MREISEIIVHCTATPEGRKVTIEDVTRWHLEAGMATIGYHYLVSLDGEVWKGRPESQAGAHCKGHNKQSIGVCYVGGVTADGVTPKDTRTAAQKIALKSLLKRLKERYPSATIYGHRDFARKACPCFDAKGEYNDCNGV